MNSLSWALYWVDLFHSIGGMCAVFLCFSLLVILISAIGIFHLQDGYMDDNDKRQLAIVKRALRGSIVVFAIAVILGTIIPDRSTMRMILVSEYGERIYNSNDAQEIINPAKELLKLYIQEQLAERKK